MAAIFVDNTEPSFITNLGLVYIESQLLYRSKIVKLPFSILKVMTYGLKTTERYTFKKVKIFRYLS